MARIAVKPQIAWSEARAAVGDDQLAFNPWHGVLDHNAIRPHASLGYRPPAPEVMVPTYAAWPAALTRPAPPSRLPMAPRPTVH